ncbi:MAG TPA: hypothetical protein VNV60_03195 [Holophagaceae bacterium]|nr:hypothetical protein [Holophagaceae bacterium]
MEEICPAKDDAATLAALGVLAYLLADGIHEALGHGGACLLGGRHVQLLSSAYFHSTPGSAWTDVGGPLANLGTALLFGLALRRRIASPEMRLFLRLALAFNLFWASGQMIYSAVSLKDDWAFAIAGLEPQWLWRAGLGAVGVFFYEWGISALARGLAADGAAGPTRTRRLLIPYVAAGLAACAAALFFRPDRHGALHEAILETFGANLGLLLALRSRAPATAPFTAIARRRGWVLAASLALLIFAATLGRGLVF